MKGCTNYTDEATHWTQPARGKPSLPRMFIVFILGLMVVLVAFIVWPKSPNEGFAVAPVGDAPAAGSAEGTAVGQAGALPISEKPGMDAVDGQANGQAEKAAPLVIYLTGAVVTPGVYELEQAARLNDAIERAGGLAEGAAASYINLAVTLEDGQHIHIPSEAEIESGEAARIAAGGTGAAAGVTADAGVARGSVQGEQKVNINTANAAELESLPGVGVATAQRIIDYREKNGPFASVEGLKDVSGIGEKKYAELADRVCI
ncbi:MAG: ComEA family DNA-binding protein [Coriobacteriales bacterium]|jgi:competence protein ComEA|nr:ComEA family DNA-binding protein [Coriobacteriales bacterium]